MRCVFVRFLEEIEDTKKTLRNYLTFITVNVINFFVKMSQMQVFYTKSCNLPQARTRYLTLWIVGICEKAVIDSHRKNQTYLGENLQFCIKTEGF